MVSELAGEPVHAVLPPPRLRRFRELAHLVEDEPLEVVVGGSARPRSGTTTRCWSAACWCQKTFWETARIDHPFFDSDFGEWATGLWRAHCPEFPELCRQRLYEAATPRSAP